MARWLLATATLLLYLTIRGSYSAVTPSCDTEFRACERQYLYQFTSITLLNSTNTSDALCQLATQTLLCLSASSCPTSSSPISSQGLFRMNMLDVQNQYCGNLEFPTTPLPLLPAVPLSVCIPPALIPANTTIAQPANLALPNIQSNIANVSCLKTSTKPLLHCSAFGYSHLRSFGASSVQTCFLPGSWFLFKHELLTVEVSAVADVNVEVPYTRITKINITLFDHTCFRQRSYVATANNSLPQSFSDGSVPAGVLQLSDTTTVAITVPWMNTTVIVRSDQGLLAVTLQAPIDLLVQSQGGICIDGCSPHTRLTTSAYISNWASSCVAASNAALLACVLHSNTFNAFQDVSNDSYTLVCQFELLVTGSNDTLRFLRAVASDATRLPSTEHLLLPGKVSLYTYLSNVVGTSSSSPPTTDTTSSSNGNTVTDMAGSTPTELTSTASMPTPCHCSSLLLLTLATLLSALSR